MQQSHYDILNINPSSSPDEIKKAFRQLALMYHPDITNYNELKAEQFRLIKEAYSVLFDADKRKAYDAKHFFTKANYKVISIETILEDAIDLSKKINSIHPSKLNYDEWGLKLDKMLTGKAFTILSASSDGKKKEEIIICLNDTASHLPYKTMLAYSNKLQLLTEENEALKETLLQSLGQRKKQMLWEKYKITVAIAIAVIACLLIVLMGKL